MAKYTYNPPYNQWSGNRSDTLNKWKINYKGSIATASALPSKGEFKGDTYNVLEDGSNYMWNGNSWDKLDANIYIGATSVKDGIQGLVPPASNSQIYSLLTGGGTWENAEDLGLALDDEVVHLTGNETLEGVKTFQNTAEGHNAGDTVTDLVIRNPEVERGVPVEGGRSYTRVILADAEGDTEQTFAGRLGLLEVVSPKENDTSGEYLRLACYKYDYDPADPGKFASFDIGYDLDGVRYATAPATSDDRTNSTDIVTRGYMEASEWNWQKTKKDAVVQFKPVPESDLEPIVDFMFTETPPAEGEKSPDNPSTITGVSNIYLNQLSDNLCVFGQQRDRLNDLGDGWFGGTIDNSNSSTETYAGLLYLRYGIPIDTSKPYCVVVETENCDTFSIGSQHNGFLGALTTTYPFATVSGTGKFKFDLVHSGFNNTQYIIRNTSLIAPGETKTYKLRIAVLQCKSSEVDLDKYVYNNPLNQYTIQLGDTYYGGSLDVASGVMTVTHYGYTFTGQESFSYRSYGTLGRWDCTSAAGGFHGTVDSTCTHYPFGTSAGHIGVTGSGASMIYFVVASEAESPASFLAEQYAAGTPVVFVTKLPASEWFTVQLTPQQIKSLSALDKYEPRVNTVYTDQEAVQVGYQRYFDESRLAALEARIEALEASQG